MLSRVSRRVLTCQKFLPFVQCQRYKQQDWSNYNWDDAFQVEVEKEEKVFEGNIRDLVHTQVEGDVPQPMPYSGPDRDLVNFPRTEVPEYHTPTRLCMFPESWFTYLRPKIGVSGPYTLGLGVYLLAIQKEWLITGDAEFHHLLAFWGWCYIFSRSELGVKVQQMMENQATEDIPNQRLFEKSAVSLREEAIACEKAEQQKQEGKKLIFDAKKVNVALQQEATYRENSMDIYTNVKRRLDYLVEVGKVDSRVKQKFLVNWVIDRVGETLQQKASEKDTLKQCINDLNTLAARA